MPNINNLDQEEMTLGRQGETKEQKTDWEFAQALTRWYEIAGGQVDEQKKQEIKKAVGNVRARDGQKGVETGTNELNKLNDIFSPKDTGQT